MLSMPTDGTEKEREAALENFAEYLVSTRNMFSNSKANYDPTGFECPIQDLATFVKCIRVAAQQLIHYFDGIHPDRRVI